MNKKPIIVIGAIDEEIDLLIGSLNNAVKNITGGHITYEGSIDDYPVVVVESFMGLVNAASSTTSAIEKYDPLYVINVGTCGSHRHDLKVGDILVGEKVVEFNNYSSPYKKENEGYNLSEREIRSIDIFEDNEEKGIDSIYSDYRLLKMIDKVEYEHGKVEKGTIGSADVWDREIDYINYLHSELKTDVEDMESVAVGQVCRLYKIPFISIRVVSNNTLTDDLNFNPTTARYCQEYILSYLKLLIKTH